MQRLLCSRLRFRAPTVFRVLGWHVRGRLPENQAGTHRDMKMVPVPAIPSATALQPRATLLLPAPSRSRAAAACILQLRLCTAVPPARGPCLAASLQQGYSSRLFHHLFHPFLQPSALKPRPWGRPVQLCHPCAPLQAAQCWCTRSTRL